MSDQQKPSSSVPHSSSMGSIETINSREPHDGKSYIDTTAGSPAGRTGLLDPTGEDAFWSRNFSKAPYVEAGEDYATFQPAYRYGWESYGQHNGRPYEEVEIQLSQNWGKAKGQSKLTWERARAAVRDAWTRLANYRPAADSE